MNNSKASKASGSQNAEHGRTASLPPAPHALSGDIIVEKLNSTRQGISAKEAESRLQQYGSNSLPRARQPSLAMIFLYQFKSPLIYVLVAAAIFSMLIQEWSDAVFISGVLLINAIIGTIQEYSAQQAATALQKLVTTQCRLIERGRGSGIVVATGLATELGAIASEVINGKSMKPPLLVRMEIFTHRIAIFVALAAMLMAVVSFSQGMPFSEIFMLAVALLVISHKAGIIKTQTINAFPELSTLPFESERLFSASLNKIGNRRCTFVKGAVEKLLPMCKTMALPEQDIAIDIASLELQANDLARQGYRVLAIATGDTAPPDGEVFCEHHLHDLTLLGLVGMIDPLRAEAKKAVASCRKAGIKVAMVTGDHPATAMAIAKELKLTTLEEHIVTGPELRVACSQEEIDKLTQRAHVFARIEPAQKLDIVRSLQRNGHFVAVSGDGANDAPALRAAQVGVAMGKSGTDVARETADIIITDDNFNSIVSGVEEGRISYANVRKVIFLLISTGAAELVLFTLALLTGLPLPLLAVQLLWLNLVTNGIQDVALAFEPGEGDELKHPPRSPKESIFNRIMIERIVSSALVIGIVAFYLYKTMLEWGYTVEEARNSTLLLMVLFENIHVFNCRSETLSIFRHNPMRNRILLFGTVIAQLIHIGAMYTPWISSVLGIQPVSIEHWFKLLGLTLTVIVIMELHKLWLWWRGKANNKLPD